jgi:hypothetical protein
MFDLRRKGRLWAQEAVAGYWLQFSPNGQFLAVSPQSDATEMYWLSSVDGRIIRKAELESSPFHFEYAPDGKRICVELFNADKYVVLDAASGRRLRQWPVQNTETISDFVFTGRWFATGDTNGMILAVRGDNGDDGRLQAFPVNVRDMDATKIVAKHAFEAEMAFIVDFFKEGEFLALYDLDNDGQFERARYDSDCDGQLDCEFTASSGSEYQRHPTAGNHPEPLFLDPSSVPEAWRKGYARMREKCMEIHRVSSEMMR